MTYTEIAVCGFVAAFLAGEAFKAQPLLIGGVHRLPSRARRMVSGGVALLTLLGAHFYGAAFEHVVVKALTVAKHTAGVEQRQWDAIARQE